MKMEAEELFDKTIGFEGLQKFIENYDSFGHVKAMIITIMEEYAQSQLKERDEEIFKILDNYTSWLNEEYTLNIQPDTTDVIRFTEKFNLKR